MFNEKTLLGNLILLAYQYKPGIYVLSYLLTATVFQCMFAITVENFDKVVKYFVKIWLKVKFDSVSVKKFVKNV